MYPLFNYTIIIANDPFLVNWCVFYTTPVLCALNRRMEFTATPWLTWQRAQNANIIYHDPPVRLGAYYPDWLKNLKADVRQYLPEGYQSNHTARVCLGLRGINSVGWTIPWPKPISGDKSYLAFHPEQLHGTKWCEQTADGEYVWDIILEAIPWRAKMSPGWRLIVGDYPLAFSENWHTFSGCVDANYNINKDGQLGSFFTYEEPIDPEFNYYNIETVLAIKKGFAIPGGCVTYSMIPYYDPDYRAPAFRGFPDFNP